MSTTQDNSDWKKLPLLELNDVSKRFQVRQGQGRSFQELFINLFRRKKRNGTRRHFWPLQNVSFSVYEGESVGIVGPNGSGKSTLLKLVGGILEPTSGTTTVRGRISALLELGAGFHPDLTGRENIFLNGSMYGLSRSEMREQLDAIIEFSELGDFIDMPIKHYSSGMYVRLGFAVAIHTRPDILLIDEVLAVGDATFQHKCMDAIQAFRQQGGTLLLVTHDLGAIQSICDRAIWYENGRVQAIGHPTEIVMGYLNHVAEKEEASRSEDRKARVLDKLQKGNRWGTGRIEITEVQLCDSTGEPSSVFVTGAPMHVHLRYVAAEPVSDPVFGIALHHQNGTHVCGPNTDFSELQISRLEDEGEISYEIPALPLLEGGYQLSVAVHNRTDTEMYDYHDRAYSFRVYRGKTRELYGLVTMNGQWNWQPAQEEDQQADVTTQREEMLAEPVRSPQI